MISVGVVMTVYLGYQSVQAARTAWCGLQLDDVRVPQQLQILDLALDAACHIARHQALAVDDLQGDLLATDLVGGQLDLAKGALTQSLHDSVLAQTLARLGVPALTLLHDGRRDGRDGVGASGAGGSPPRVRHGDGELLEIFIVEGGRHGGRRLADCGDV
jgi:hypothetical protein